MHIQHVRSIVGKIESELYHENPYSKGCNPRNTAQVTRLEVIGGTRARLASIILFRAHDKLGTPKGKVETVGGQALPASGPTINLGFGPPRRYFGQRKEPNFSALIANMLPVNHGGISRHIFVMFCRAKRDLA